MRKLLVVLSAIMLVAAFAVPVFADWSGEVEFGFTTVFDPAKDASAYGSIEADFSKAVDDYNSVALEFDGTTPGSGAGNWTVGEASISTDIGKATGLPVGLTLKSGYFDSGNQEYADVTGWGLEDVAAGGTTLDGGFDLGFGFGPANLDVAFSVAQGTGGQDLLINLYMPDLSGASVELYYDVVNNDDLKGAFGVDGSYAVGPATVAAGFEYDSVAETWQYGLGVSAGVSMATLGVSLDGNDDKALAEVGLDANLAPADNYGVDLGVKLSMKDDDPATTVDESKTLQCVDISAYYKVGAATIRVGYDVTETGESYNAPAVLTDDKGGLYADVDLEF